MKFIQFGKVTAPFAGYTKDVAQQMGHQHTGIDSYRGWGTPTIAQNDGYVYKVHEPDNNFNWAAVHMLVEDGDDEIEWIPLGHANAISVKEGDFVREGQVIGYTGNHGYVFWGGRKVTVQERREGSRKGTHNHQQCRPVRKVTSMSHKKHYLRNKDGTPYQDKDGFYREVKLDNDSKGCVDPMTYYPKKASERLEIKMFDAAAQKDQRKFFILLWHILRLVIAFEK